MEWGPAVVPKRTGLPSLPWLRRDKMAQQAFGRRNEKKGRSTGKGEKGRGPEQGIRSHVVYGGDDSRQRTDAQVLSWRDVQRLIVD